MKQEEFFNGPKDGEIMPVPETCELYVFSEVIPTATGSNIVRYLYQRNWEKKFFFRGIDNTGWHHTQSFL